MNICFETFGCRLNRAEALENEATCLARGHRVIVTHHDADLIVVRGCSVTSRAQHECEHTINAIRERYPNKRIFVTGCLPNAKPFTVKSISRNEAEPSDGTFDVPKRTSRAYIKIQDGCHGACTFCIVPRFRGEPKSVDFDTVVRKASAFIDAGYREIVLTGCNLSLYRTVAGFGLPELVAALAALSPDVRIRVGSIEPGACARELVHVMAENENVCRFLHLPVQSGSDRILRLMKRPYAIADVESLVLEAKSLLPRVSLGCDMMSGFPSESEHDHELSKSLVTRHGFMNVHAFPFSKRPGTPAWDMSERIPHNIRSSRAHELADAGKQGCVKFARQFVNREVKVVIENEKKIAGWSGEYVWTQLDMTRRTPLAALPKRRELVTFRVTKADGARLYGTLAAPGRPTDGRRND